MKKSLLIAGIFISVIQAAAQTTPGATQYRGNKNRQEACRLADDIARVYNNNIRLFNTPPDMPGMIGKTDADAAQLRPLERQLATIDTLLPQLIAMDAADSTIHFNRILQTSSRRKTQAVHLGVSGLITALQNYQVYLQTMLPVLDSLPRDTIHLSNIVCNCPDNAVRQPNSISTSFLTELNQVTNWYAKNERTSDHDIACWLEKTLSERFAALLQQDRNYARKEFKNYFLQQIFVQRQQVVYEFEAFRKTGESLKTICR